MRNIFGGENGTPTPTFPLLFGVEDLHLQYAATNGSSGQLQLLTPLTVPVATTSHDHHDNEFASAASGLYHPKKQLQEPDSRSQIPVGKFLQSQPCQPNPTQVSTGLRLAYNDEEQPNSSVTSASENLGNLNLLSFFNEDWSTEMNRQKSEIEHYMRVQEEQLAQGLKEIKQRHMASFLGAIREGLGAKLREKDAEIENGNMKNKELMEKIKQLALEAQSWHNRAKYNEAMVNALRTNLQQAVAQSREQSREGCGDSEVDDAASSHYGYNSNNFNNGNNASNNMSDVHARVAKENKELRDQRSCR
ncbi:hypothetical protein KI387_005804, partial [Taxus chinensis]